VCLAVVNLSPLGVFLNTPDDDNETVQEIHTTQNQSNLNPLNAKLKEQEKYDKFFTYKSHSSSFTILSEVSNTLSFINEMSTNLTTKFDHIASFKNSNNFLG